MKKTAHSEELAGVQIFSTRVSQQPGRAVWILT
jgi:hypothetical protein